jgi:heat shock protein HslJ
MRTSIMAPLLAWALCAGCATPGGSNEGSTAMTNTVDLTTLVGSTWLAEDIGGKGVMDDLQSRLQFLATDRVAGQAGCNQFDGAATLTGASVSFGPLATTRKMWPPAVMDQERRFIKALESARGARLEDKLLFLLDADGSPILRLSRLE